MRVAHGRPPLIARSRTMTGGKTFCPMDDRARIIRKATPRFAKIVSHKFARGAAAQVVEDLEQNHGRPCLKASLQDLATRVGTVVQTKEESWSYATPALGKVATVGIGVDGTRMLICDQNWREAPQRPTPWLRVQF